MKKGQIIEGLIEKVEFPNKGIMHSEGKAVLVKDGLNGQRIQAMITKARSGKSEARILQVLEHAPQEVEPDCPHFGTCGGCTWRMLPYDEQLKLKENQVKDLMNTVLPADVPFEGIHASPQVCGYRNKMEFTFGDAYKNGPLSLGMHKKGSFYDIVTVDQCRIVDEDFRNILTGVLAWADEYHLSYYHRVTHKGSLRHLLVRKAAFTEEILIDLVTTSQEDEGFEEQQLNISFVETLLALPLKGKIAGILHTWNDSVADAIVNQRTELLYGQGWFYEQLLGLRFRITPFSFFQTNSAGAEVLYSIVRSYMGDLSDKHVFDLYSGTGTIAQIAASNAAHVTGIEIVPEAVDAARENAALNHLENCSFIAGDVLKMIDEIEDIPDLIILDPPRDGIHPKALEKIIRFGVDRMIYISCKPTSLIRDLEILQSRGYSVEKYCCVDMFPAAGHVETVVQLSK